MPERVDTALPVPLTTATAEFDQWMRGELLADQARSTPLSPLYQYTGEPSLRGILENRKFWCFSHSQQSDDTEVRYPFEIARRVIEQEAARGRPAVKSILTGPDGILTSNPMGKTFDFYFISLNRNCLCLLWCNRACEAKLGDLLCEVLRMDLGRTAVEVAGSEVLINHLVS